MIVAHWEMTWKIKAGDKTNHNLYFTILLEDFQETIQIRDGRYTAHVNHECIQDEKDLRLMLEWSCLPTLVPASTTLGKS
jgi:hypothetical protein